MQMESDKKWIELPEFMRHKGYGHMGNLGVFRLRIPLTKHSELNKYHWCYYNDTQTIFDIFSDTRNAGLIKLKALLDKDNDWYEVDKSEWDKENKAN